MLKLFQILINIDKIKLFQNFQDFSKIFLMLFKKFNVVHLTFELETFKFGRTFPVLNLQTTQ